MSTELNHKNQLAKVNRLPAQVLSTVFTICQRIWDKDSERSNLGGRKPYACQLSLSTVCRLWRKVALDTSALSALILSRSGETTPLDIDLCMTKSFWETDEDRDEEAGDALDFITKHGPLSRWNTIRIEIDTLEAFYRLCPFFQESTFPSLQSLELCYSGSLSPPGDHRGEISEAVMEAHLEFDKPPSQLRSLKLHGLVIPYFFGLSAPSDLSCLESLELRFAGAPFETYDFDEIEVPVSGLSKRDSGAGSGKDEEDEEKEEEDEEEDEDEEDDEPVHSQVLYSSLTSLSFLNVGSAVWVLNQLVTLDAPNVSTFELTISDAIRFFDTGREATKRLVNYVSTKSTDSAKPDPKPLFPSLSHLTYSNSSEVGSEEDLEVLLPAYPQLVSLAIPDCNTLAPLMKQPWLVPGLTTLRVGVKDVTELKNLLVARRDAGIPIRAVQVEKSVLSAPIEPGILKELEELGDISMVDMVGPKYDGKDEDEEDDEED